MNYYDQTFEPYKSVDGRCVVADQSEWEKVGHVTDGYFEKVYLHNPGGAKIGEHPKRPIVKLLTDIFKDVEGPVVNRNGSQYWKDGIGDWFGDRPSATAKRQTTKDLLTRTLQTIDATPHVDYLITTLFPERVREIWPVWGCHPDAGDLYCRDNVTLATYVETQTDIELLVPELLKCHDLVKGLAVVCNPKEELDFRSVKGSSRLLIDCLKRTATDPQGGEIVTVEAGIDLIIAEGKEHPMHPDWIRSLREQCKNANVKFNFAAWGDWVPIGDFGKANSWTRTQIDPVLKGSINGEFAGEYETLFPWQESVNDPCMIRGYQRSGQLLDGVEHNGRIQ